MLYSYKKGKCLQNTVNSFLFFIFDLHFKLKIRESSLTCVLGIKIFPWIYKFITQLASPKKEGR